MKLSVVAALVRKGINLLVIFVVLYYLFTAVIIPFGKTNIQRLFPSKNAPTVLYGMLDPLEFVKKPLLNSTPTYTLNTKNGKLPTLATKAVVFKYNPWRFSYADGTNAQKQALILGFSDSDLVTDLKGENYKWRNALTGASLGISIHSKELSLDTPLVGKYGQFLVGNLNQSNSVNIAKNLFNSLGRFSDPFYKNGTQTVVFGRITGTDILQTSNYKEAHIAKVDLFKMINQIPVYGPDPKEGLLQVYIGYTAQSKTSPYMYPKVEAYYWETEQVSAATYPLVSLSQAWEDVKKGNGIISSVVSKNSNAFHEYTPIKVDKILVNNIYIAYYETPKLQKYMQPIYVFDGNYTSSNGDSGSIVIYYPAVSGKWINATPKQSSETSN